MNVLVLLPYIISALRSILILSLVALLSACSRGQSQETATAAPAEQAIAITTRPIEIHELRRVVEMVGTLRGWEEVTVSNETPGTIDALLSIYSVLGVFLLMGVVKKNAILQVDYTNHLRAQGLPRHDAQIMADRVRLRPILMTTMTIIAGMLPIALGRGDGAAARASLAMVVVGGQAMCLVVTLLVTPVVYSFFDDFRGLRLRHVSPARLWRWTRARAATASSLVVMIWTGLGK